MEGSHIYEAIEQLNAPQKRKARGKTGGRAPIECWLESMRRIRKHKYDIKNTKKNQHKNVSGGIGTA
jgi:hypothetical protein